MLTLDRIHQAAFTLRSVVRETDLIPASGLVLNPENAPELYLKPENLQVTGSFKVRGAYFKMSVLKKEGVKGVVACSAGNHAQGVALAAQRHGLAAKIFIPSAAPISKIEATRKYGAEIVLADGVYDDAYEQACAYQQTSGDAFVHPFDDADIIAGQGTIGLELFNQMPDIEAVVVPVGGGGLLSGIAYAIKNLNPSCKVYGVQAQGASSMAASIAEKRRATTGKAITFADGIAVKMPGELTFSLCEKYADGVVTVSDDEIAAAILAMMEQHKLVSEGAGAVAVAAVMFGKVPVHGKKTVCIVSGGNIDVNILSRVINRGLLTAGRISDLTIEMLDKPGQLHEVSGIIASHGANVIKVHHNHAVENMDINGCHLHITMETRNHNHLQQIETAIKDAGYVICKK